MRRTIVREVMLALGLALTGCGMFHRSSEPSASIDPNSAQRRYDWKASLVTPSGLAGALQVRGTAEWSRDGNDASIATVSIANATAGGVHPWHVHRGRCGDNGPIVGSSAAYKPLAVSDQGTASATAKLDLTLPTSGEYYVNVHASATNLGTIISCGNLAPPVS
jgi:hypothetical protein